MSINNKSEAITRIYSDFHTNSSGDIKASALRTWLEDFIHFIMPGTPVKGASIITNDITQPYSGIKWEILQPTGAVTAFAGSVIPTGWLLCNGSSVSQATYPNLYSVIGTTYGIGSSGQFVLPDLRGRSIVSTGTLTTGIDPRETTPPTYVLGQKFGRSRYSLIESELPPHFHDNGSLVTTYNGTHAHLHKGFRKVKSDSNGVFVKSVENISSDPSHYGGEAVGDHQHGIIGNTGSVGSSIAVENRSPMIALNYIIKT